MYQLTRQESTRSYPTLYISAATSNVKGIDEEDVLSRNLSITYQHSVRLFSLHPYLSNNEKKKHDYVSHIRDSIQARKR